MNSDLTDLVAQLDSPEMAHVQAARRALIERGPVVAAELEALARDGKLRRRWELLAVLAEFKQPSSFDLFVDELARRNPLTGQVCVTALLNFGEAGQAIVMRELTGMEYMAMLRAVQLIGELRVQQATPLLIGLLSPGIPPSVVYTVVDALAAIGDRAAIDPVRACLDHEDRHVRQHAEHALKVLEALAS